jgi:hypothetical protein
MAYSSVAVERSPRAVGSPLPSIFLVALVTAALGGVLAGQATWASAQVIAGLAAYAGMSGVIAATVGVRPAAGGFGIANQVTLLRAGLVCLIGGALLAGPLLLGWSLAALVATALSLDAVDGWLARHFGMASRFGARFDLEVDALLLRAGGLVPAVPARPAAAEPPAPGDMRPAGHHLAAVPAAAGRRHVGERGRRPRTCRIVGILRRRHHLSCAHRGPPIGERWCCARPGSGHTGFHTGTGVNRRCAAIVPWSSPERPRGDRA